MSRVSNLYRYQVIDLKIDAAQDRIKAIDSELADNEALQNAKANLDQKVEQTRQVAQDNSGAEHAVEAQRQKIDSTDTRLYSGTVTNPKELEDLQAESESLNRHLQTLEDRLLETMVILDDAAGLEDQASKEFDAIAVQNEVESEELVKERKQLIKTISRLNEEREVAAATISENDMAKYQELRENYKGLAIADLSDGSCSACGLEHTASVRQKARLGEEFIFCDQCKRILFSG